MRAPWLALLLTAGCASTWTAEDGDSDGYSWADGDCDDRNPAVFPDSAEVCDGLDNDCDGETDGDSPDALVWYGDVDGDGYTGAELSISACAPPPGYTATPTDCDDGSSGVSPAAIEYCDGLDNDCDGETDEGDAFDAVTFYADDDGDGYGDPDDPRAACALGEGLSENDADCDDENGAVYPGALEVINAMDDDCDGETDELI